MKRYHTYKDSGVEWIGNVPEGWDVQRLKRIAKIVNGSTPKSSIAEYWEGDIVWVTPADIGKVSSLKISESEKKITHEGLNNCGASIVPQGSIILTTRAPIGNLAIATTSLCTNQGCKSLIPTNVYSPYLFYSLFVSKEVLQSIGSGTTFKELSTDNLASFMIALPPQHEQKSIAAYLDRKATQIDNLISKKQKLIELLKEERAATINQAVTKGLNPDAPMKDSGIEWLGEVPAHWEVKRLKYIARITLGKMLTNVDKGGYHYRPYLRAQNINWEKVNVDDVKKMWFSKDEIHQYRLNKNDLLVSEGGEAGRTAIWDEEIEECL
jgi:type I restriction enzyme S subunit